MMHGRLTEPQCARMKQIAREITTNAGNPRASGDSLLRGKERLRNAVVFKS